MQKVILVIVIFYFFLFPFSPNTSFAQDTSNASQAGHMRFLEYAYIINANEKNIKDGSIISFSKQVRVLSSTAYDSQASGIVSRNVGLTIYNNDRQRGLPIISNGVVYVLVSTKNGFIKKGDQIATSTTPGVGVKAIKSGYIVGTALEDYDNTDPNRINKIAVNLNLRHFNLIITFPGFLFNLFNLIALPITKNPFYIFVYIIIGIILASIAIIFLNLKRSATEILKTNPNAEKNIHLIIVFNIVMVFVIILTVFTLSFLLFRL